MKSNIKILILISVASIASLAFLANAGTSYNLLQPLPTTGNNPDFGKYMEGLIRFLVLLSAVAAVVMITIGGALYAFSEALETQKTARSMISDALLGLLIALLSYLILYTINPDLVNLKLTIPGLPRSGSPAGNTGTGPLVGGPAGSNACIGPDQCASKNCPFFPGTSQGICQPAGCNNPNGCSTTTQPPASHCSDTDCGGVNCGPNASCFCPVNAPPGTNGTCNPNEPRTNPPQPPQSPPPPPPAQPGPCSDWTTMSACRSAGCSWDDKNLNCS